MLTAAVKTRRSVLAASIFIVALGAAPGAAAADSHIEASSVCLEVLAASLPEDSWPVLEEAVGAAVDARSDLFPDPLLATTVGASSTRLDIQADPADPPALSGDCLVPGSQWTARVGRSFLDIGADRMLALAPTTPGIDSSVNVEWYPDEARVTTTLVFAGPLDIPNGTCWIDDALGVDASTGSAVSTIDHGVETSLFAESACERFFDHLSSGGAGEQALTLLPGSVELSDGSALEFPASAVSVDDDAIVISGDVRER